MHNNKETPVDYHKNVIVNKSGLNIIMIPNAKQVVTTHTLLIMYSYLISIHHPLLLYETPL